MTLGMKEIIFLSVAALTTVPCLVIVLSRNILYSAFALFFAFLGTSGLYFFLEAEFLAITQVVVYIGGVSVILLFAILLTKDVNEIRKTNMTSPVRIALAGVGGLLLFGAFVYALRTGSWAVITSSQYPETTITSLGDLLLGKYLLPFEVSSLLLLAVLIGSLVIARRSVK